MAFSSLPNAQLQLTYAKVECVWVSWLSLCIPYTDCIAILAMIFLTGCVAVLTQPGWDRFGQATPVSKCNDSCATKPYVKITKTGYEKRFSTQLVRPTEKSRMTRVQSTPDMQSCVEVATENGLYKKQTSKKDTTLQHASSAPDFLKLLVEEDSELQVEKPRVHFLSKPISSNDNIGTVEGLWDFKEDNSTLHSGFFQDSSKESKVKKTPKTLNPDAVAFVPPPRENLPVLPLGADGAVPTAEDVFASTGGGMYVPSVGYGYSVLNYPKTPYVCSATGQAVDISSVYCKFGEKCMQYDCGFAHVFSDGVGIQVSSANKINALTSAVPLPVVPYSCFPEHTQRLLALGLYNARPVAPKYSIAVIPTLQKKRRPRRSGRFKDTRQVSMNSSLCTKEDSAIIRNLVSDLSCLNRYNTVGTSEGILATDSEGEDPVNTQRNPPGLVINDISSIVS